MTSTEPPRDLSTMRFVDLCAGMGGFHLAMKIAAEDASSPFRVECVLAAEIEPELRELYVRNFPALEESYARHHPPNRCAKGRFQDLYDRDGRLTRIHGDIRDLVDDKRDLLRTWSDEPGDDPVVPEHDLLVAGFPCQPFSKSGAQKGFDDLNGTVFRLIAIILKHRRPSYVLLENVGNFERHDDGNTWKRVREVLEQLGYDVRATLHVGSREGRGLLSPHHIGLPHHRERFFIVAQHVAKVGAFAREAYPFPRSYRLAQNRAVAESEARQMAEQTLRRIVQEGSAHASADELRQARINTERARCILHWNELLSRIGEHNAQARRRSCLDETFEPMPSFPIWGYELDPWNWYPFRDNPGKLDKKALRKAHAEQVRENATRGLQHPPASGHAYLANERLSDEELERWVESWPGYASSRADWPAWKVRFIEQNRDWGNKLWRLLDHAWLRAWVDKLLTLSPSHQKLEWNCQGGTLDLWQHILQFRPSGLRTKRLVHVPALVAMTTTQVPIVPVLAAGAEPHERVRGRHLLLREAAQLQGFPESWQLPKAREQAFHAVGNAIHAGLVAEIARVWLVGVDDSARWSRVAVAASPVPAPSAVGASEPTASVA